MDQSLELRRGIPTSEPAPLRHAVRRKTIVRIVLALALVGALAIAFLLARRADVRHAPLVPSGTTGMVVLDLSASVYESAFGPTLEKMATSGERAGLVVFSDAAYEVLPPGSPGRELLPYLRFFRPAPNSTTGSFPPNPWQDFRAGTRISQGLAVAREALVRRPGTRVVVLEREPGVAHHQTSHNSGVIHAGLYYAPGSLKARLCVDGARRLYELCDELGVPTERCGKLVVARHAAEVARLDELERRARANGVPVTRVAAAGIQAIEPNARGVAALHSPDTGIVDFARLAQALREDIEARGAVVVTGCAVQAVRPGGVEHELGETRAGTTICCAGLQSDRLAERSGEDAEPRIVPFRGAYFRLRRPELVRALIYPVPDPGLPFLGVHLTRRIQGDVVAGPTALHVGARDAYRLALLRAGDVRDTLRWPGTWRMAWRWRRHAMTEVGYALSRRAYAREARTLLPDLRDDDLEPGFAGIRAQALARDGTLLDDFAFSGTGGVLHVRNAPSPAATASLAIAGEIADRAAI